MFGLLLGGLCAVGSLFGSIGSAIGGAITALGNLVLPIGEKIFSTIGALAVISKSMGIIEKEEEAEELGVRATIAAQENEIKPEDFNSYKEYIERLREIDEKKVQDNLSNLSEKEKREFAVVGMRILSNAIEENTGVEIPNEAIKMIGKLELNGKQCDNLIKSCANNNVDSLGDINKYLQDELPGSKVDKCNNALREALKTENPEASSEDIGKKIMEFTKKCQEITAENKD